MLVRNATIALLATIFYAGCDATNEPDPPVPVVSDLLLRPPPNSEPKPGDIPAAGDFNLSGPTFQIRVEADGRVFRGRNATSVTAICDELRGRPNLADTTILISGDSHVRIGVATNLQSELSDALPNLGSVVYTVADTTDGGEP